MDLADALLEAIGFGLDHAFGFHSSLISPYDLLIEKEFTLFADQGEGKLETDTGVEDAFSEGETMLFHFDYGESWMFLTRCESIEKTSSRKRKPEILSITGEFPEQYPPYDEEDMMEEEGSPSPVEGTPAFALSIKTGERIYLN